MNTTVMNQSSRRLPSIDWIALGVGLLGLAVFGFSNLHLQQVHPRRCIGHEIGQGQWAAKGYAKCCAD